MGYRNVEPFTLSGLTAEQYRALLRQVRAQGVGPARERRTPTNPVDFAQILAENETLGIKYFGSGGTPKYATEAEWIAYAQYLDELGAQARQAGQTLMVHNHNWEFQRVFGDRTAYDILMAYTDPQQRRLPARPLLGDERRRLGNPVELLERYGNRIQLFHVKDMAAGPFPGRIEIVGEGIIDFPAIFAGVQRPGQVLRRRARPALRRPDVRPVRSGPEGLRLPRLRHVLSARRREGATTEALPPPILAYARELQARLPTTGAAR